MCEIKNLYLLILLSWTIYNFLHIKHLKQAKELITDGKNLTVSPFLNVIDLTEFYII